MMTDPLKPLGISIRQLTGIAVFLEAGGRQFVDVTRALASPASRAALLAAVGKDPLTASALQTILDRGDFITPLPDASGARPPAGAAAAPIATDPAIPAELIARSEASIASLKRDISAKSGPELLDFIRADFAELKRTLVDPQSHQVFMTAMEASWWLNEHDGNVARRKERCGHAHLSAPNNVTSEMGLALLDVADVIRPHRDVVAFLEHTRDDGLSGRAAQGSTVEARRATPSVDGSTGTACAASERSTSPALAGANARRCSSR